MKKVSTREIKITCTSYELEYTLTEANQNSKNICLSVRAVNKLQSSDEAHIIVKNPKGKIVSNKVYTGDYIKKKVVDIGQDSYVLFKY